MFLWAVHIADGFLAPSWLAAGFVLAGTVALVGAWRVQDDELPRVALMTAVFFVASQIHLTVGPSSAHLLLNGLLGVVLRRRALLAIPVGLLMQAALFGHGGYTALGINSCVMAIPALAAWAMFSLLNRVPWSRRTAARETLVAGSAALWALSAAYGSMLLAGIQLNDLSVRLHAAVAAVTVVVAGLAMVLERRRERSPEFAIGLCVGEMAVLLTIGLHCVVVVAGGNVPSTKGAGTVDAQTLGVSRAVDDAADEPSAVDAAPPGPRVLALVILLVHLPIAALEGLMLGFLVSFLARVKPELIGAVRPEATPCATQCAA